MKKGIINTSTSVMKRGDEKQRKTDGNPGIETLETNSENSE